MLGQDALSLRQGVGEVESSSVMRNGGAWEAVDVGTDEAGRLSSQMRIGGILCSEATCFCQE